MPASRATRSAPTSAKLSEPNRCRAAAISAVRVCAVRSPWVRRPVVLAFDTTLYFHTHCMELPYTLHGSVHVTGDTMPTIDLQIGPVDYRVFGPDTADAPVAVFVHGFLVNGTVWDPVAQRLRADGVRLLV